jgi:hypothetical protein
MVRMIDGIDIYKKEQIEFAKESLAAWIEYPIIQIARQIGIQSLGGSNPGEPKFREMWDNVFKDEPVVLIEIDKRYKRSAERALKYDEIIQHMINKDISDEELRELREKVRQI